MKETKLLNCPFCGGEAEVIKAHSVFEKPYVVICKNKSCHASVGEFSENRKDAITAWNTRKPMERILKRLERNKTELFNARNKYRKAMFTNDDAFNKCKVLQEKEMSINETIKIVKEECGIE